MHRYRRLITDNNGNSITTVPWLGLYAGDPEYAYKDRLDEYDSVYSWEKYDEEYGCWEHYDSNYWTEEGFRNPHGKWRSDWSKRVEEHEKWEHEYKKQHAGEEDKEFKALIISMLIASIILFGLAISIKYILG